jgi:hypothetical protein
MQRLIVWLALLSDKIAVGHTCQTRLANSVAFSEKHRIE